MLALALLAAVAAPIDYRQADTWLCRPGRQDACATDTRVTIVTPDGDARVAPPQRRRKPAADCFYVYPTVSLDPLPNSDMAAGAEERGMVAAQLAAFGSVCRLFAPLHRQVTLGALRVLMSGKPAGEDRELPYADIRAAWRDYLAHDNRGRPFVLIGHSQGSLLLKRLVAEEIDGKAVQARMLAAILPGTGIAVPAGGHVGGDFKSVPLCRAAAQTGCVLTWASYRDTAPPPANALFGKVAAPGMEAGCTNPAELAGRSAPLDAILGFPWWRGGVAQFRPPASGWAVAAVPVATRFVRMPGLVSGQCLSAGGAHYLAVHVAPGLQPLADTVTGPDAIGDASWPDWGWHVVDLAIVQGDLLQLVEGQTRAWRDRR